LAARAFLTFTGWDRELAGNFYVNSTAELSTIYGNYTNTSDFRDILSGSAGSFSCKAGYDFVTGVGSDQGTNGK
jgi:hypothetical protein